MRKKDKRGSTLGWVIMMIMVVMILLMSALAMSASHIYRYQRNHNRRQIHMTAISVASAIAKDLEHPSGEGGFWTIMEKMLEESEEGEVTLSGLDERMGEVRLYYSFDGVHLVMTVQVQIGKETGRTKLAMRRGGSARCVTMAWEILGYGTDAMEFEGYRTDEMESYRYMADDEMESYGYMADDEMEPYGYMADDEMESYGYITDEDDSGGYETGEDEANHTEEEEP